MPNRFHDNLLLGFGDLDHSRPLDWNDPVNSPRVYGRPQNLRQIVSWWGRVKAAWQVLTLNAVAVKWYDEKNAHTWGRTWSEQNRRANKFVGWVNPAPDASVPRVASPTTETTITCRRVDLP